MKWSDAKEAIDQAKKRQQRKLAKEESLAKEAQTRKDAAILESKKRIAQFLRAMARSGNPGMRYPHSFIGIPYGRGYWLHYDGPGRKKPTENELFTSGWVAIDGEVNLVTGWGNEWGEGGATNFTDLSSTDFVVSMLAEILERNAVPFPEDE